MANLVLEIDSAATGTSNLNSGSSATVKNNGSRAVYLNAQARIALFSDADALHGYTTSMATVATDGSDAIRVAESTAGKRTTFKITAINTTNVEGDGSSIYITKGSGTNVWTITGATTEGMAALDVINIDVGGTPQKTYIISVDGDYTLTLYAVSGAADSTNYAFCHPPQITVYPNPDNAQTTGVNWKIGGRWESLYRTDAQLDAPPGTRINVKTDETKSVASTMTWYVNSGTTLEPVRFVGRGASDPTVLTYSNAAAPFTLPAATYGCIFEDLNFVSDYAVAKYCFAGNYLAYFTCKNVKFINTNAVWTNISVFPCGTYNKCTIKVSGLASSNAEFFDSFITCTGSTLNTNNVSYPTRFFRCRIVGPSGRAAYNFMGNSVMQFCDCVNITVSAFDGYRKNLRNNSFSFDSAYAGYVITYASSSSYYLDVTQGAGGTSNNYYNCTGLIDPTTYPSADVVFTNTVNINPGYSDISNGNATNTALNAQGLDGSHIGSYAPASGSIFIIED